MRDVRDWNKYVDLLGKSVVQRPPLPKAAPGASAPSPAAAEDAAPGAGLPTPSAPRVRSEPPHKSQRTRREETREELLSRLLDPVLTLEETARILQVCSTTVRRYTNKGLLTCERSPGNQRRFRWSQVYAFMEAQAGQSAPPAAE